MKTKTKSHPGAEDILNDLRTLAADAKRMFEDVVQEPTADAIAALRSRMESARDQLADYYEMAKEKSIAGAKATDAAIRQRPYHSLAIALGVGVVLGLYFFREREQGAEEE